MAGKQRRETTAERHERMSAVDTAWWRMDGPGGAMVIVSVLATATRVRAADVRQILATRLLRFPRFRQRPVADPPGAAWHESTDFDLDAHVVTTRLPEPAGQAQLEHLAAQLAGERLDPTRPLWQVHFVEHYGTGSAWVWRVHHCYADGKAMVHVLSSLTGPDAGPARTKARRPRTRPDPSAPLAANASGMVAEFARLLTLADDPPTPLRGPLSGVKGVAWSVPLDLEEVTTVGRALGCTVNDVLLATVTAALGAHLRDAHGVDTSGLVFRASVPVNLRAAGEPLVLGNKFGLVFVDLPIDADDPLHRVFRVHDTMAALKGSLQPSMTLVVLGMLGLLPTALQAAAIEFFSRKGTLVASNVPGPKAPLYLCGQRISELYFWVPQSGSMGVGISILSYAGQVFLGIIADRNLVPDPAAVAARFAPEFERLLLGATVGMLALGPRKGRPGARTRSTTRRRTTPPAENTQALD